MRSASFRYKLTLSLDTQDGVKTGFNVVEIDYSVMSFPDRGEPHETKGEALYLDLGPGRRPLIALLAHGERGQFDRNKIRWGRSDPTTVINKLCQFDKDFDSWISEVSNFNSCKEPYKLPTDYLPDLVTFADVDDPKSVILVDPNNLAATLGPGISWRSMTLQTTDEPLTTGIEQHLRWLSKMSGGDDAGRWLPWLSGRTYRQPNSEKTPSWDFSEAAFY